MPIFLKIDGVMGDSTDAKHIGWFEVDGFDFGATRPVNTGGEGTGRVTFSPLSVDISSLSGLAPLLGDLTSNKLLKTVELVEVTQKDQTVYDLKLTNAVLDTFSNAPGPHGVETGLKFDFKTVSLTDHGVTSDGAGAAETTSATASRFTTGGGAAVTSETITPVPGGSTAHYFLKVAGVKGDSIDAKHMGWFEVDGFDFGATRPVSTGGQGSGKVAFSPLSVDISSLTGLAPLLGDLTSNKVFNTVELVEVTANDQTVYDLTLTKATLDTFSNSPGPNGVETDLTFGFQKVSLTDHGVSSEGGPGPAETVSATAQRFAASAAATSDTDTQVPGTSPLHYFLKVDGVTGS